MTDAQIWEAIECCFTGDEARRMGLSLSLFAREIERRVLSKPAAEVTNYCDIDGDLRSGVVFCGKTPAAGTKLYVRTDGKS